MYGEIIEKCLERVHELVLVVCSSKQSIDIIIS